ncbi:MAG: thermonuclease family protein [Spirochaetales bacterium]|nr:thermonuclease family protein [Spirochaetales bacterium]
MPLSARAEIKAISRAADQISQTYDSALKSHGSQLNRVITTAHWQIGKKVAEIEPEPDGSPTGMPGLLKGIAERLNKKYGKGFSARNLRHMRKFYNQYDLKALDHTLSWTHYRLLLRVDDPARRQALQEKAISQGWSVAALEHEVVFGKGRPARPLRLVLSRPEGLLYFYRLTTRHLAGLELKVPNLDCGFKIWRNVDLKGLAEPADGLLVQSRRAGRSYRFAAASDQSPNCLYTYRAFLERAIDGDTVIVHVDCGFETYSRQRLRLRSINAPDPGFSGAERARRYVEKRIPKGQPVVIKTHGSDKYERYLVDVLYLPGAKNAEKILAEGRHLNQEMLEEGVAVYDSR